MYTIQAITGTARGMIMYGWPGKGGVLRGINPL